MIQRLLSAFQSGGWLFDSPMMSRTPTQTDSAPKNCAQILNQRSFDGTISSFAVYLREASVVEIATRVDAQARSGDTGRGAWINNPILDK